MQNAKEHGIINTCVVFDGTFVTEDNLVFMFNESYSFISAFSTSRDEAKILIDAVKKDIEKVANRISDRTIYGVKKSFHLHGIEYQAHIYYSPERKLLESQAIYDDIDKLTKELDVLNKSNKITRRYTEYFKVDKQKDNPFTFELNADNVDQKISRAGFFILISSDKDLDCEEVLKIYREKDVIEKNFHQLKNPLDFRRFKTHWNKTTEGKMFVGFIALILRTKLLSMLRNTKEKKKHTFEKLLIELEKIRVVQINGKKEMLITLTKKQKDLLGILSIDYESI
jgi:transposase